MCHKSALKVPAPAFLWMHRKVLVAYLWVLPLLSFLWEYPSLLWHPLPPQPYASEGERWCCYILTSETQESSCGAVEKIFITSKELQETEQPSLYPLLIWAGCGCDCTQWRKQQPSCTQPERQACSLKMAWQKGLRTWAHNDVVSCKLTLPESSHV